MDAAGHKLDAAGDKLDAAGDMERIINEDSLRKMKAKVDEIDAQFFLSVDCCLDDIDNDTDRITQGVLIPESFMQRLFLTSL